MTNVLSSLAETSRVVSPEQLAGTRSLKSRDANYWGWRLASLDKKTLGRWLYVPVRPTPSKADDRLRACDTAVEHALRFNPFTHA